MRDADVRLAVREMLWADHKDDQSTRIVEEMGIWAGSVRIDIAVINGELCGYELKSDRDTLERLPNQASLYSRVFDRVCLVAGAKHAQKAKKIIPKWWGLIVATSKNGEISLSLSREAKSNPSQDPIMLAQLLWKTEALQLLENLNLATGWRSKPAPELFKRLATQLPLSQLAHEVRETLKQRVGWLGQPRSNQRKVAIGVDLDPALPASWFYGGSGDLLDATISPTMA